MDTGPREIETPGGMLLYSREDSADKASQKVQIAS